MQSKAATPQEYLAELPPDRQEAVGKLREVILANLPAGFEETMGYGMLAYVVPHSIYPDGYHCDPKLPLPFMNVASQKNFIALYHMGIYSDPDLLEWCTNQVGGHLEQHRVNATRLYPDARITISPGPTQGPVQVSVRPQEPR